MAEGMSLSLSTELEREENTAGSYKEANQLIPVDCSSIDSWRELTCIEYPGIVKNDEKALKTLGGLSTIAKACQEKAGYNRLEMRSRPDNVYCKPSVAKQLKTFCLVIKLRRTKLERPSPAEGEEEERMEIEREDGMEIEKEEEEEEERYVYSAELIGLVTNMFEFNGMFDFQVNPPGSNTVLHNGSHVSFDPMASMLDLMDESCLTKDFPIFLPPLSFSKLDYAFNFAYKPDVFKTTQQSKTEKKLFRFGKSRLKALSHAYSILFTHKGVPDKPRPDAPLSNSPKLKPLKKLFEERPVWRRVALQTKLKVSYSVLKPLLPLVCYCFISGPWKKMWVKFGYDPRADPSSKIYQCIDYRIPRSLDSTIAPSATHRKLFKPLGAHDLELRQSGPSTIATRTRDEDSIRAAENKMKDTIDDEGVDESVYNYYPDVLPCQRQLMYMLCDIHEKSVQELIHSNDGKERSDCDETVGWLEDGSYDKIRRILSDRILSRAQQEGHKIKDVPPISTDTVIECDNDILPQ